MADFDVSPTFLSEDEADTVFNEAAKGCATTEGLTPNAFVEALCRSALLALSRPTFGQLYPTPAKKVAVLLQMWRLGDPRKLREVHDRMTHAITT
jgi:hypothetical protein